MPSLRDYRRRIRSVKNTQQITRAMKMVSAAKLRRAQALLNNSRKYADGIKGLLDRLSKSDAVENIDLYQAREEKQIEVIIISSDKGLCGSYNANIFRKGVSFIKEKAETDVSLVTLGKKGGEFYAKRNYNVRRREDALMSKFSFRDAGELAAESIQRFRDGQIDALYGVFAEFRTALSQKLRTIQLLPFPKLQKEYGYPDDGLVEYIFEPNEEEVLTKLLPQALTTRIYNMMINASASEHGSRMTAMDAATDNAEDMIDKLTLKMNRARQAAITKEIIEVVSGADALKQ